MKTTILHSARAKAAGRLDLSILLIALALSIALWSCSDPRNEPPTAPDPGYTQTIVLAERAVSNGNAVSMPFTVESELAAVVLPGQDQPARLFVTAFIRPDADVDWRESIIEDSIPAWDDPIINYQVAIDALDSEIDDLNELADSCEAHPESCSADSLAALEAAIDAAEAELALYQDSLGVATDDTTRLGAARDSLAAALDARFNISIQFDGYPGIAYPSAVFTDEDQTLSGQNLHLAATDSSGVKGKTFVIDLAQFDAADENNIGRPIEFNWVTCFAGSDRPCMSPGSHSFAIGVSGGTTWVTATLVLVYAEER